MAGWSRLGLALLLAFAALEAGAAQNYGTDARQIGMGGIGERSNMAWDLVPASTPYRAIPVPLGLFQVLRNLEVFDPGSDDFNPARAISYASNPMHYTFGRAGGDLGESFVLDLVNAGFSTDLNDYRGFVPKSSIEASSVITPKFGKTFWLFDNGYTFHGIYAGAGPYMTFGAQVDFDEALVDLLEGASDTYLPNTTFTIQNATGAEAALAFTGGYRLKLPIPGGGGSSTRDGIYVAANYTHLYGLHYEDFDLGVQLDTDEEGMLAASSNVLVDRMFSSNGKGRSIDMAVAVVVNRWDFTAAIEGLGNHLEWRDLGLSQHSLTDLMSGGDFVEVPVTAPSGVLSRELPIRYSGGATFDTGTWAVGMDVAHGLDDIELRGGMEYRFGPVDFRGGGRFVRDMWHPTTGIGLNVTDRFGIDVAMLGLATNIEQAREMGLAVSLRLGQER
jgi:hypothetical protein